MTSYGLEILSEDECAELLSAGSLGRVAVWTGEHPAILPVLYRMLDGDIVFRTAPGEKLIAAALRREVVFEIDNADPATHAGWSVNVVGEATEIVRPEERARVAELGLEAWAGEYRDRFVRILTRQISGRRLRPTEAI